MTYNEATTYLFNSAPLFQNIGAGAYKEGLSNTNALDSRYGHPHRSYRTIHVGGTNGKGSVSHTLAAILQCAGYKVGLYTSPHLADFRERIRVNGQMIPEQRVIDFVTEEKAFFEPLHPSFFELATALAFLYFKEEKVDVAVIEVGLGGRLDCTNIINPDLSVITNISKDHVQFLGDTPTQIAKEKAGIIKPGTPVVIGETNNNIEVRNVFITKSKEVGTSIKFADEESEILHSFTQAQGGRKYQTKNWGVFNGELGGDCQEKNTATILCAVQTLIEQGYNIKNKHVHEGIAKVCSLTGLMGRWQRLQREPLAICDTGHNIGGMQYIVGQLASTPHERLHFVIGMVNDKDIDSVLGILPKDAEYYFTQASVQRALSAESLAIKAGKVGLKGVVITDVKEAYRKARQNATKDDLIFVGGSTFVVADLLKTDF
ncbi:MAG: folylpolyglutamate synthase/dihydrofolate synthase family protein [Bacteroidaceae bacterium]|nr:folylpolyglutamate synthase/dihydrofolate synthase family protein [Bacteroidaceae bacterium]